MADIQLFHKGRWSLCAAAVERIVRVVGHTRCGMMCGGRANMPPCCARAKAKVVGRGGTQRHCPTCKEEDQCAEFVRYCSRGHGSTELCTVLYYRKR